MLSLRSIILSIIMFLVMSASLPTFSGVQRTGRLFSDRIVVAGEYTGFCQDKEGYIWIGTNKGLFRFDGNTYDIYRHDDSDPGSVSDSRILGVMCDTKGRVWVATANGLNLYMASEDSFKVIPLPARDFYGYIIGIAEQVDGTVTFVVSGVGLYVVDDESGEPTAVKYNGGAMERDVNSIVCGPKGRIYMGTRDGRLIVMASNGRITPVKVSDGVYIKALAMESDGNVLVSTLTDLYRFYPSSNELRRLAIDGRFSIKSMSNPLPDRVYIATSGQGLWSIAPESDTPVRCSDIYCPFMDIDRAKIGAVYNAPDGNLWLGCDYKGVVMVPGKTIPFTYRRLSDYIPDFEGGLSALGIWKGNVIACLDKGRVVVLDPSGRLLLSTVIPGADFLTHIEVMEGDKALISVADNGVWQIDLHTGKASKYLDIPGKYPSVVTAPGHPGELFVGVHGTGLMRYNELTGSRSWIPYEPESNTFSNPYITCLNHTDDDKIWIGLYGGIACFDLKRERMLEIDQEPFLKGATFAIVPCLTDSSVWVGTSHGLIHLDPSKGVIGKFTTANGLSDNDVRSITRDHKGGKWIATMHGMSYVPADNDTILSYYGGNGLEENFFNQVRFSPTARRIYAGSDMGITSFMPDSLPAPGFGSEVKVSAVFINGKRIAPYSQSDECQVVPSSGDCPVKLKLPYKDNALTFRLSTMDYRDASNIRYRWRLSRNEDWIVGPPGENTINLPHLDPGSYDLEICALENNVVSPVKNIRIEIAYPWYMTFWARLFYILLFLTLIAMAFIVFKKKKEEEVNEDKIKFFMDVSHDIRSPMTLIMSPLESLMKDQQDPAVRSKLNVMHRNAQRVMSLVNQLLDIRKLDKGKMRLNCRQTDVCDFVSELVDLFRTQAEDKKQTLTFTEVVDPGDIWLDRDNFDKIMVNLISNAIKYTPEGGAIDVAVSKTDDDKLGECLKVTVTDTGIGLDAKTMTKLFEPFYRVREDHAPATMGCGIGLDLCRRLVELHHGSISAANREDDVKGSVFTVLIPMADTEYSSDELIEGKADEGEIGRHLMPTGAAANAMPSRGKPLTAGGRILVVDDDEELRRYISSVLGKYYYVKEAPDGGEALKIVADWQPDIVVSDVVMPNVDGLTLVRRLKSNSDTTHIPVVLLSSKTAVADRMSGWDKGADAYIGKPFSIDELEAVVDTLIENRQRLKGKFSGAQETEGKIDAPEMKGNDEVLLDRIMKEINAHIDDPDLNVERLASEVGVSRAHLHRKMKDLIGMTPSDYIRNIRIKRACELLKRHDIEVTQVAYKIGFTSQPHFSAHFKRYTGFSPSEYRAKCLSGSAPEVSL